MSSLPSAPAEPRATQTPRPARGPAPAGAAARFDARVRRLAAVSAVALGAIWGLWLQGVESPAAVGWLLAAGWALMPAVLAASLRWPRLRYGLAVPAAAVSVALLGIDFFWLPGGVAGAGWLVLTGGILLGGLMGTWLWYRWLPVPSSMEDPHAPQRLALISVHVALVVAGLALVLLGAAG